MKFLHQSDQFHISINEQCNLRSNFTILKLAKPRTNALKRSFCYHGAKTWNNVPTELKDPTISDRIFKVNYKVLSVKIIH